MGRSKPASIRFDPEKLDLVKHKEKLTSPQKVVDFLLDAYWWQNKLILAPAMSAVGQALPYVAPDQSKTSFEVYADKIRVASSQYELNAIAEAFTKDTSLRNGERDRLSQLGKNASNKL